MVTTLRSRSNAALRVVSLDGDLSDWTSFVAQRRDSSFCHLAGWREIMTDVLGHDCPYAGAVDEAGALQGVLPLVRVRAPLVGHYLVSMPFLNAGGPLGEPAAVRLLAQHARHIATTSGADLLELRTRTVVASSLRITTRKITVLLPLPAVVPALWERFPAKLRSQIRHPQKLGLETRFGPEHRDAFYDVFAVGRRTLGTPVLPAAFFENIATRLADQVVFGAVYDGTRPVAAGCGFVWNDEFEITWAASLREYNRTAANMLLYWSLMEEMIRRGVRVFNFGRCTAGSGTHRFKRQWGGFDVPLPWLQWSARAGSAAAAPVSERPVFRLAAAVWRHVPLPITRSVGPLLARQLP